MSRYVPDDITVARRRMRSTRHGTRDGKNGCLSSRLAQEPPRTNTAGGIPFSPNDESCQISECTLNDDDLSQLSIKGSMSETCARSGLLSARWLARRVHLREAESHKLSLLWHKPHCTETDLVIQVVDCVRTQNGEDTWLALTPIRLGHSKCLDDSAAALLAATHLSQKVEGATVHLSLVAMARALNSLREMARTATHSDEVLSSIAGLVPFDYMMGIRHFLVPTHLDGLAAVFSSYPPTQPFTEVARRTLDYKYSGMAIIASIRGRASPLESAVAKHHG